MQTIMNPLEGYQEYLNVKQALTNKQTPVSVSGCIDSQKCHLMYGLGQAYQNKVIVTYSEIRARELVEEYRFYEKDVCYFPAKDLLFYDVDIHGNMIAQERLGILRKRMEEVPVTIVVTVDGLMDKLVSLEVLKSNRIHLAAGEQISIQDITTRLVELGYEKNAFVEQPGEFAIRGGIFDVYPITEDCPYRIELWDDEIDSIRSFDVESQRSIENVDDVWFYPATEVVLSQEAIQIGLKKMEKEQKEYAAALKKAMKTESYARSNRELERVKEELHELGNLIGVDAYLPYFYENTVSFLDYFPKEETLYVFDEPNRIEERAYAFTSEFQESMKSRLEGGYILPSQAKRVYTFGDIIGKLNGQPVVYMSMLIQKYHFVSVENQFCMDVKSIQSYNNSFEQLLKDLKEYKKKKYRILVLSPSNTRAKRFAGEIRDAGMEAAYHEKLDKNLVDGEIMVSAGKLKNGFEYPSLRFVVISETDIFQTKKQKKRKNQNAQKGTKIKSFSDISIGDYVVHENHGVGIYRGIEKIEVDKVEKDYIDIEYKGGSHLFMLASQLDLIQKYASANSKKPKINKLGGSEWINTKKKVKGKVNAIAKDLVELYAIRQSEKGFACDPDTIWQTEFEELFPYDETDDQLNAIEDTKRDMESDKIMDRLICGDVGYGKTEVAIRAAFKAVTNSKQVVYLVPTTILAQQHYNSFVERMKDYPIRIEMMSRFRTPAQQKKTIEGLKKGSVDIVVGTHRVLSKDIEFKDLGLLIIDEEQRFGVAHKEKIKKLRKNVDVLSLSATPIPRTLHMSLIGIRDMSLLEEPPVDRRAIQTYVMEFNEEMIREAILRELNRGGQVYYVYNRVNNIEEIAAMVRKLVPEAVVEYAHGQMSERALESKMFQFMNGEIDVLVSTTIIETGLDISNVNTMIIHDANNLGLSQLYQLRGRVGRSNRTAYAFLMYKRDTMLKETAEKRLQAIREFTDLGSGFKIAMRDLEIRGAGNLLGEAQSGHMEAVGYDLYCKMLNDAVLRLKGEAIEEAEFETVVDLQMNAFIPASYVKNEFQKLELYKRISEITSEEDYEEMTDELIDRFGDMPNSVTNLLHIALLRSNAHRANLLAVEQKGEMVLFKMYQKANVDVDKIPDLLEKYRNIMKFQVGETPTFRLDLTKKKKKERLPMICQIVSEINDLIE
ncbi:MAG: transcription-repair coupling factor [Lachnospiraceae bacterium]|nr:transcription-repair coupling factor [Lachnospiraceae bacterium]